MPDNYQHEERTKVTWSRKRAILTAAFTLGVIVAPGAADAQWRFDPVLRAAWDYDDNATLSGRTDEEVELSGYIAEASVDFVYDAEGSFFSFRPRVRSRDYGNESNQNSDDQFARLLGVFEGQRNNFRIIADYEREAVRTAELADADLDTDIDPDDIANDQSGIVGISERRERYRMIPRWTYRFSSISSIETTLDYLTVRYDEPQQILRLFDFTDAKLRVSYRRDFSQRNLGLVSISARDFDTDRFGGDRTALGLSAGFVHRWSPTTQLRAQYGLESIDQEDVGLENIERDVNPVFDISLVRRLETIKLLAQYRQRISASGQGALSKRDEVNLRLTRNLNDRFSAGIGVRAYTNNSITGAATEQDYVQLRGQVLWNVTRAFFMQVDYRHTVIDRTTLEGSADSNRITVWFTYRPNPVGRDPRLGMRF